MFLYGWKNVSKYKNKNKQVFKSTHEQEDNSTYDICAEQLDLWSPSFDNVHNVYYDLLSVGILTS